MPGWITLSDRAQPGMVMAPGITQKSVIGRDGAGRLAGMASRWVVPGFWQGQPARIGWVGHLRLDKSFRHRPKVLLGGFEAFRAALHDPAETPWYLATVVEGNLPAKRLLEAGLPGFPQFTKLMPYHTLAFRTAKRQAPESTRQAGPEDAAALARFLADAHRTRPLAPVLTEGDLRDPSAFSGLRLSDFVICEEAGKITGAAAVWDQRPYRGWAVTDYRPPLRQLRAAVNIAAPVTGLPHLPRPGAMLAHGSLAFFTATHSTARPLIAAAQSLAADKGLSVVSVGLMADDPLLPVLNRLRHRRYDAALYGVTWLDGERLPPPDAFALAKIEICLL